MGITVAPLTTAVMSSAPREFSGIASGINNTMARSAGVIAVAIMGGIALINFSKEMDIGSRGLDLPEKARMEILSNSKNFGETPIPETLSIEDQTKVSYLIKISFVNTFKKMGLIAAMMVLAGVLITYMLYKHKIQSKPQ